MPMIVSIVLVILPRLVGFRWIVTLLGSGSRICRNDGCPLIQIQRNSAFQMNRVAKIIAGSQVNRPSPRRGCLLDYAIDRGRVQRLPISAGAKCPRVIDDWLARLSRTLCARSGHLGTNRESGN